MSNSISVTVAPVLYWKLITILLYFQWDHQVLIKEVSQQNLSIVYMCGIVQCNGYAL
jgi:hypothetical protein